MAILMESETKIVVEDTIKEWLNGNMEKILII